MSRAALDLSNTDARRIFLHAHALSHAPTDYAGDTLDLIRRLGFVQVDSIQTVARAHHHILHSRCERYTPSDLHRLHRDERALFEHWTHDASIIPIEFYPFWTPRFARAKARIKDNAWWAERLGSTRILKQVLDRIRAEGPLRTRDFEDRGTGGQMWNWGRSKAALEYLWHSGALAIVGRDGFQKIYDLAERVIPEDMYRTKASKAAIVDWACRAALERLGFASAREITQFWMLIPHEDVERWVARQGRKLVPVRVEGMDGKMAPALALPEIEALRDTAQPPPAIMRALSPFDPAIRNRKRVKRLFDFDYTIEIFVPEAKRKYGYYVYPLLDGNRLVGRVDAKADRSRDALAVRQIWHEDNVMLDKAFQQRQSAALADLARFGGVSTVEMPR